MSYFAVGDIHGCYDEFQTLLSRHWNPDKEKLILLGDLIDRGERSFDVIHLTMKLKKEYGAVIVCGNHDELFIDWLDDPEDEGFYYDLGGRETIDSFFGTKVSFKKTPSHLAKLIKDGFSNEILFLKNLPNYYETKQHIFVHAGVNLVYENWKNTSDNEYKWIREPFIYGRNETGKTIVFGHTPTRLLNQDKSDNVWISDCKTKIGLDGACVFGGLLHGLKIDENIKSIYSIPKNPII